jgi:hypothetical protein
LGLISPAEGGPESQSVELILRGHVDIFAHTIEDGEHWDQSIARRLKTARVSLIPTLTLFSGENGFETILHEVKSNADEGDRYSLAQTSAF